MVDVVTGGSGFLGSHIVSLLLERGRRVRVLDIDPQALSPPGAELIRGSVTDPAAVCATQAYVPFPELDASYERDPLLKRGTQRR